MKSPVAPDPMTFAISEDADQDATLADDSPRLLIEAPPGTGKSLTAIRLIGRDLEVVGRLRGAQRILALTFSRHARMQLERYAVEQLTREQRTRVEITNYHSFFWSKIESFRSTLGLPLGLELSNESQHRADIESAFEAAGVSRPANDDLLESYGRALEYGVAGCRPPRWQQPLPGESAVAEALHAVHRRGRIHFDDMAFYMWRLVDESAFLRRLWAYKYPVLVLDEYQDTAPLQAAIVDRIAPPPHRVYAFADPRQMIYGWRDASPTRAQEFAAAGASRHRLRTMHRFRGNTALGSWLERAREILEGKRTGPLTTPAELTVLHYDPKLLGRGDDYRSPRRELGTLVAPLHDLRSSGVRSVAVMVRLRQQVDVMYRFLRNQGFIARPLAQQDEVSDWLSGWIGSYDQAERPEVTVRRLLEIIDRIQFASDDVDTLRRRVTAEGLEIRGLRQRRRELAEKINASVRNCRSLRDIVVATRALVDDVTEHSQHTHIAHSAVQVIRKALNVARIDSTDSAELRRSILARIRQQRIARVATPARGILVLTCHETKSMEFDAVVLPFVSTDCFPDKDEESQLLYVSLSRARSRLIIRAATGRTPTFARALGIS